MSINKRVLIRTLKGQRHIALRRSSSSSSGSSSTQQQHMASPQQAHTSQRAERGTQHTARSSQDAAYGTWHIYTYIYNTCMIHVNKKHIYIYICMLVFEKTCTYVWYSTQFIFVCGYIYHVYLHILRVYILHLQIASIHMCFMYDINIYIYIYIGCRLLPIAPRRLPMAAEGPRGGGLPAVGPRGGGGGGKAPAERPGEAPKDLTKPRPTLQSPNRLY